MSRKLLWFPSLLLLSWIAVPSASAIPDPTQSTVDACLVVCPGGDLAFHVVVRDIAGNPEPGAFVQLDLCSCPDVVLCGEGDCLASMPANAAGQATFFLSAGGTCATPGVAVRADGVLLATVPVASPDQDGSLLVDPIDDALLAAKIGGSDLSGDLNCDGTVSALDSGELQLHMGHTCLPVQNQSGSWGRLKAIYR